LTKERNFQLLTHFPESTLLLTATVVTVVVVVVVAAATAVFGKAFLQQLVNVACHASAFHCVIALFLPRGRRCVFLPGWLICLARLAAAVLVVVVVVVVVTGAGKA